MRLRDGAYYKDLAQKDPLLESGKALAPMTTFRLGGEARLFAEAGDLEALRRLALLARAEEIPSFVLGGGSDTLFDDLGLEGLALKLGGDFRKIELLGAAGDAVVARAGAGASLAGLLESARAWGLAGLEGLAGVPGTVGGAARGNAGAAGVSLGDRVLALEAYFPDGDRRETWGREKLRFGYRELSWTEGAVILSVDLGLTRSAPDKVEAKMAAALQLRREKTPLGLSAGSVFKNPPGDFAGRLVEEAGLKGYRLGGAVVSERHANVIVNRGDASASEVRALVAFVKFTVFKRRAVELVPEIRLVTREGRLYP
ncbi:MAG: UDP-N-acetylmuramate dehydrogenase [Deltaproteobacteria bacterium]|jgi:UDP-N-acetylmuramate dehydrogenase|nr:UDP-N-acetylmuramate dehydrogenase [Deltaproteobacteria bacterium]